jgi:hypothetical protein
VTALKRLDKGEDSGIIMIEKRYRNQTKELTMRSWLKALTRVSLVFVLLWCSFGMGHSSSPGYNIPRQVLDGGGAMGLSAGSYKLSSSLGQSIAGVQEGDTKIVYVGFWYPGMGASDVEWEEVDLSQRPTEFGLRQNYPNPFNPVTTIQYALPKASEVKIEIYNILGQRVRILVDEHQDPGYKMIHWDGKDDRGDEVSSGIYLYRIQAGDFVKCKKMTLLK